MRFFEALHLQRQIPARPPPAWRAQQRARLQRLGFVDINDYVNREAEKTCKSRERRNMKDWYVRVRPQAEICRTTTTTTIEYWLRWLFANADDLELRILYCCVQCLRFSSWGHKWCRQCFHPGWLRTGELAGTKRLSRRSCNCFLMSWTSTYRLMPFPSQSSEDNFTHILIYTTSELEEQTTPTVPFPHYIYRQLIDSAWYYLWYHQGHLNPRPECLHFGPQLHWLGQQQIVCIVPDSFQDHCKLCSFAWRILKTT